MKKGICLLLAIMFLLTGCNGGKSTVVPTSGTKASNEKLELTFFYQMGTKIFDDNWAVFQKAGELTNVYLKGTVSKMSSDQNIAFNTMIATRPLPDVVWNNRERLNEYAMTGAFVPLNDLIDKYAPNIKKYLEENPNIKKNVIANDKNLYIIPSVQEQTVKETWFIRQDWLDKLGKKVPTTIDELYDVASAIRNNDPNCNGTKDEIPFFGRVGHFVVKKLLNVFGVKMQDMKPFYERDGKIAFSYLDPQFKNAMITLSKWYKEGLIDPEIYTRKDARTYLLANNIGGITSDWHSSTSQYNDQMKDKISGFNFQMMLPPKDVNNEIWDGGGGALGFDQGWAISVDNKHPEATMKYFDFWYTEEGKRLNTMGIEGLSYEMKDGKPQYTDAFAKGTKSLAEMMDSIGGAQSIGGFVTMDFSRSALSPNVFENTVRFKKEVNYLPPFPNLPLSKEEMTKTRNIMTAIYTFCEEKTQKWLLGEEKVEENYDKFISDLDKMGIKEVLEIYNAAYEKYKKMN